MSSKCFPVSRTTIYKKQNGEKKQHTHSSKEHRVRLQKGPSTFSTCNVLSVCKSQVRRPRAGSFTRINNFPSCPRYLPHLTHPIEHPSIACTCLEKLTVQSVHSHTTECEQHEAYETAKTTTKLGPGPSPEELFARYIGASDFSGTRNHRTLRDTQLLAKDPRPGVKMLHFPPSAHVCYKLV